MLQYCNLNHVALLFANPTYLKLFCFTIAYTAVPDWLINQDQENTPVDASPHTQNLSHSITVPRQKSHETLEGIFPHYSFQSRNKTQKGIFVINYKATVKGIFKIYNVMRFQKIYI